MNFAVDPFLFLNIKSKYLRGDIQISFTPAPKCFRHFLMGTTWLHTPASPTHENNRGWEKSIARIAKAAVHKKLSLLSVLNFPACPKFCLSVPQLEKAYEIAQTKIWSRKRAICQNCCARSPIHIAICFKKSWICVSAQLASTSVSSMLCPYRSKRLAQQA